MLRILAVATTLLLASAPAHAESGPMQLSAVSATWVQAGHVELHVAYEGGACEEMADPEVNPAYAGTNAVVLQTISTSEVCTKQIVTVEFVGIIAVEPTARILAVTVLDTTGRPMALGSATIH